MITINSILEKKILSFDVLHPKTAEVIWKFILEDNLNCKLSRNKFNKKTQKHLLMHLFDRLSRHLLDS